MKRPPGLGRKFLRAITLLVAVVLLANAGLMWLLARSYLKDEIEDRGRSYGRLVTAAVCEDYEAYYRSGYSKFREKMLGRLDLNGDLTAVALYDTGGRRLFHSRDLADPLYAPTATPSAPAAEAGLLEAIQALAPQDGIPIAVEGGGADLYRVVVPYIEDWGRHRYSVVFDFSYRRLSRTTAVAALSILLLSAASLGLGWGFARLLAAGSLVPLRTLTRGAQALAEGHLERRLDLRTGDEFETLAGSLNTMAAGLERSMSELEASNQALTQANEELRQLDRMKSDLLANVSHELRTPLTAIKGYVEAIDDGLTGPVSENQQRALGVIQRNIQRLQGMIEQLLSFSRLESGRSKLERHLFDLGAVVEQAAETLRAGPLLGERQLRVADLPDEADAYGDPDRIAEVLDNLLSNAAKFTEETGHISLGVEPTGSEEGWIVWVADDGKGIAPGEQSRIFDRFYQVDSSSRRSHGGMGLGLAIVREILEAHGSRIQVESTPGQGTTLRYTLPARAPHSSGAVKIAGERGAAIQDDRRRVLLIDDDPGFGEVVSHFLERRGFVVETAASAEEGWRRARRRRPDGVRPGGDRPDIILLDRLLPDADGFDLLARLKEDETTAHLPVLMVSIRREKALGLRLGASGYLAKPVDPERLLAAVRGALRFQHPKNDKDGPPRVLVVDDEPDLRDLLSRRLLADGLAVDTAADGPEALEMIKEAPPDLLLLDLMMPGMDGWELLRRLRADSTGDSAGDPVGAELPVIVITARDSREDRRTGEQLRVLETVTKPFDLTDLVAQIEQTLANSEPSTTGDRTGDRS